MGWVCECFEKIKVFQGSFGKGEILNSWKFYILFPGLDIYAKYWNYVRDWNIYCKVIYLKVQIIVFISKKNMILSCYILVERTNGNLLILLWYESLIWTMEALLLNRSRWSVNVLLLVSEVDTYWWLRVSRYSSSRKYPMILMIISWRCSGWKKF